MLRDERLDGVVDPDADSGDEEDREVNGNGGNATLKRDMMNTSLNPMHRSLQSRSGARF